MRNLLLLCFALFTLASCETGKNSAASGTERLKMWVNSQKVACTGVAPMECLQVQYGETIEPEAWQYFYDQIEGFDFEEGSVFQLEVAKTERPLQGGQIPADAGKYQYRLVRIISKTKT